MKKKTAKRLMAASMAGTLAVTMFAGCGGSSDSKDSSAKTEDTGEDNSDKPDTWIADRTITVQAYVDDIGNTLPKDFNNTETMKKITELTGIKLDVKYTPGDSDAKVLASQLASGTIPDVIVSYLDNSTRPEFPLLYKAAKDGMFADVSEYMKNSGSVSVRSIWKTFWLSPTPYVCRRADMKNSPSAPRVCTEVVLEDLQKRKLPSVWISIWIISAYRPEPWASPDLKEKWMTQFCLPELTAILAGDFNAEPDGEEFAVMRERKWICELYRGDQRRKFYASS